MESGGVHVSATEFQQNLGRYQDVAQREPVAITKNGRPHTVLLSAVLFEAVTRGRSVRRVDELGAATLQAIADAEVPEEHAHLDALLEVK